MMNFLGIASWGAFANSIGFSYFYQIGERFVSYRCSGFLVILKLFSFCALSGVIRSIRRAVGSNLLGGALASCVSPDGWANRLSLCRGDAVVYRKGYERVTGSR